MRRPFAYLRVEESLATLNCAHQRMVEEASEPEDSMHDMRSAVMRRPRNCDLRKTCHMNIINHMIDGASEPPVGPRQACWPPEAPHLACCCGLGAVALAGLFKLVLPTLWGNLSLVVVCAVA